MDLENELSMLEGMNLDTSNISINEPVQATTQTPDMSNVTPQVAPVAMNTTPQNNVGVNTQAQVAPTTFNYANQEFDINKPIERERGPIARLEGEKGKTFRVHLLPGAKNLHVHIHSDKEKRTNFICLKDLYGTESEQCCVTHDRAQTRFVIPVIVLPIGQNPNVLQSNLGELKALILGYGQLKKLQDQAALAGVDLNTGDIFATVDNQQYKSFNFLCRPDSLLNQITNVAELQNTWNTVATPNNVCKAVARVITREEYNQNYSSYDFNKYKDNVAPAVAPQNYGVSADTYMQYNNAPVQGFGAPYQQPMQFQQPMQQGYGNWNQ